MRARGLMSAGVPLVGLAVVLAACSSSGGGSTKTEVAGVKVNDHGTKDVTGMSSLDIEADNFYFEPTVLKGTPGQKLTITIENDTGTDHNFSITSQNVDKDVNAKHDETVTVTFPSTGVVSFFCEYHKKKGMAGGIQSS